MSGRLSQRLSDGKAARCGVMVTHFTTAAGLTAKSFSLTCELGVAVLAGLVRKCLRGHQRGESRSIRIARVPLIRSAYLA
jgi:hypothetical protein